MIWRRVAGRRRRHAISIDLEDLEIGKWHTIGLNPGAAFRDRRCILFRPANPQIAFLTRPR
jgi:hypothetical protein